MVRRPSCQLIIYRNCITVLEDGGEIATFTNEQWAEMVAAVGIAFMPEGERVR